MFARLRRAKEEYPRQFWLLFWGMLISTIGSSMVWPFLMIYVSEKLQLPLSTVTTLMTVNAISGLIFSFIAGPVADRVGRKRIMYISLISDGLAFLLLSQAESYPAFMALMALRGAINPLYRVGADAMMADLVPPEKRPDAYSLLRMSNNIGISIGPSIGGFIAGVSYNLAFFIAAIGMVTYGVLVIVQARETLPKQQTQPQVEKFGGYGRVLSDWPFISFVLAFLLNTMVASMIWVLLSVYAKQNYGVPENQYGFIATTIVPIPEKRGSAMHFTYRISPGEKFTIAEVRVVGNTVTKDKVIRREITLAPGDLFSGSKVQKSFNKLRDLDYFEKIDIYPKVSGDTTADLFVDVKEKERTGLFAFGGGYSSLEDIVAYLSIEQRNFDIGNWPSFRGAGQDLKLWFQFGETSTGFNLGFTEPWFLDRPISFGPDLFSFTYDWDEYEEKHTGGDLRLRRRWEDFSVGLKLRSEDVKLSDILIPEFANQAGKKRVNTVTLDYVYQGIDRIVLPTKGDRFSISLEYAGGPWGGMWNSPSGFWKTIITAL